MTQHYTIAKATLAQSIRPMQELAPDDLQRLLAASLAARSHSHVPYSHYAVGAAVLDEHGAVHAGCNVENAAYPLSLIHI